MNHHVATGHKSDYVVVSSGSGLVQIIDNGPDHIHWLVVRDRHTEQKIALNFLTLTLLCKAVSLHPISERLRAEKQESEKTR